MDDTDLTHAQATAYRRSRMGYGKQAANCITNDELLSLVESVRGERERASQLADALQEITASVLLLADACSPVSQRDDYVVPMSYVVETCRLAESLRAGVVSSTQPEPPAMVCVGCGAPVTGAGAVHVEGCNKPGTKLAVAGSVSSRAAKEETP